MLSEGLCDEAYRIKSVNTGKRLYILKNKQQKIELVLTEKSKRNEKETN
jgi:hypothetical protein